jgi:type IV secretory pathway VirB10-like protein
MSGRVFSATIATAMIGVFILTYALSRNRVEETPPAPHAATTEASGANWPSPESRIMASTPAAAPSAQTPARTTTPVTELPAQQQMNQPAIRPPSPLTEWRQRSYLTALQAPITIGSAHSGDTLEVSRQSGTPRINAQANIGAQEAGPYNSAPAHYHPPTPPYTVMAGTVIPAVLITGINSEAPAQVLAQVAQNVFDTASGRYALIPQGSRVIGDYSTDTRYGQSRISINWKRLVLPNTASIDLPSVPATDLAGYGGLADQVDNHYLKQFGTAAVISLIDAGQMVGQMGTYGGNYGFGMPYGPSGSGMNSTEMIGLMGGSAASQQLGQVAQSNLERGVNIPPTINIRPGYLFNIEVTTDLTLPGPYQE